MRAWLGWVSIATATATATATAACDRAPRAEELDRLHGEAVRANAEAAARAPRGDEPGFQLTVSGQLGRPADTLAWPALEHLATARVRTLNIQAPERPTPTEFRGVLVRDLLDRFAANPAAREATVVSLDGFRATVDLADARRYRMLLAIEADGAPIPRTSGGPIFLIHPLSENGPALRARYPDRFWAFYVTHLIVGTEAPRLDVDGHVLERAALEAAPPASYDGKVGWKVDWPADAVHVRGIAVVDALAAAGVPLPARGRVIVRGKAEVHHDPARPIAFTVEELARCRPLLALREGPTEAPIPARLGGPIALVPAPCGDGDGRWVTFVDSIHVEAR